LKEAEDMSDWKIFQGNNTPPHNRLRELPPPPVWRSFGGVTTSPKPSDPLFQNAYWRAEEERGTRFRIDNSQKNTIREAINAALYLRRPLLLTGRAGTGKSSLAHAVAYELQMGPLLKWSVTSRTTLKDGLYEYDALERLREVHRIERGQEPASNSGMDIGNFFTLGPLGTALYPTDWPRALLIDEIDKADLDLPNDLLNIFEDGRFLIPELERFESQPVVKVGATDTLNGERLAVERGRVRCRQFPFVVLTSNGERDFPAPFLRRCVRVRIDDPTEDQLAEIVESHLGSGLRVAASSLITEFLADSSKLATDQLLNAVYLTAGLHKPENPDELRKLRDLLMKHLQ
jgi:MoxR-like ATPase